jgi:hypothetical protein
VARPDAPAARSAPAAPAASRRTFRPIGEGPRPPGTASLPDFDVAASGRFSSGSLRRDVERVRCRHFVFGFPEALWFGANDGFRFEVFELHFRYGMRRVAAEDLQFCPRSCRCVVRLVFFHLVAARDFAEDGFTCEFLTGLQRSIVHVGTDP